MAVKNWHVSCQVVSGKVMAPDNTNNTMLPTVSGKRSSSVGVCGLEHIMTMSSCRL